MLGLGLTKYVPLLLYCFSILVILITIFRKIEIGILFLIPLLPLTNILVKMHELPMGKDFVDIFLIVFFISWFINKKNNKFLEKTPFNIPIFALIIISWLGLLTGAAFLGTGNPFVLSNAAFLSWKNFIIPPILFLIVLNNIKEKRYIVLLSLVMIMTIFFMDWYFWKDFRWRTVTQFRDDLRGLYGTFAYLGPNEFASFFSHFLFIPLGLFYFDKNIIRRGFYLLTFLFSCYPLIWSFSRGAYAASFAGLLFISVVKDRRILLLLILLVAYWTIILPDAVVERITMTITESGELESSSGDRVILWKNASSSFLKNPVTGIGYSNFRYTYDVHGNVHNVYLQFLVEQGICGLLVLLYIFYLSFKHGWRLFRKSSDNFLKGLGLGFCACVISIMVSNLFGDRFTYIQLGGFFWVFLALVVRGNILIREQLQQSKISEASGDLEAHRL